MEKQLLLKPNQCVAKYKEKSFIKLFKQTLIKRLAEKYAS